MTFGEHLHYIRRMRRLTQRSLASKVGMNYSYISKIECGHMPAPAGAILGPLVRVLDAPELALLAGRLPDDLRDRCAKSLALMELLIVLSRRSLSDGVYRDMITIATAKEHHK
jgi:transcriptional regulator with XRE-family HTH domain